MSATFIERCTQKGDFDNDGGAIDMDKLESLLTLFDIGTLTNTYLKTAMSCTTAQGNELQEILDTKPDISADTLIRANWVATILSILWLGQYNFDGFETASECRTALNL